MPRGIDKALFEEWVDYMFQTFQSVNWWLTFKVDTFAVLRMSSGQ